ncbi:PIG-L deacetylase family protein [Nocardia sp. NPDC052566]|uniref:PIG-L deacetylase family protein n=1 Tax=Nocardia sp. NPDC052566 TaxID=3364330 RepID=UPI0037CC6918
MIDLHSGRISEIVVLGAHCDDIAIGIGGTLLTLAKTQAPLRIRALVLSGNGTERAGEEAAALHAFCPGGTVELTVLDIPDGRAPAHWNRIKDALHEFRVAADPQVVFAPQCADAHQDHRLLAELVTTEFRDHLVLGYEIVKWEADTPRPTLYHRLGLEIARSKALLLAEHYPSQRDRDWYDDEAFLGLARLRGVQCRSTYAEAFVVGKAVITFGGR